MSRQTCKKCKKPFSYDRKTPFCDKCYNALLLQPHKVIAYKLGFYDNYNQKKQLTNLNKIPKKLGGFKLSGSHVIGAVVAIFVVLLALNTIAVVPAGHNGIVFNWWEGVKPHPLNPGVHIVIPFAERITMMETRTQLTEQEASEVRKDLQIVTTSVELT